MAILFSTEFGINKSDIALLGVFDALLDEDSHFFINIKRLQSATVPEFLQSYERINSYFDKIRLLLSNAKLNDKLYKTAEKSFDFSEVNGINLGFSSSSRGAGFGKVLSKQIIKDAYDIVQSGSTQPEIFHLLSLFEDNVGPDRLSDMIARLVYDDILNYSKRVYRELKITHTNFPEYCFKDGIPTNPYKNEPILLLPIEILHKLPIAKSWDDIDRVCSENEAIRREINKMVSAKWSEMASSQKKNYIRESIFKDAEKLKRVINAYRQTKESSFDIFENSDYLVHYLMADIKVPNSNAQTSLEATYHIIGCYKGWVENNKGYEVLSGSDTRKAEKIVQRTIHLSSLYYCKSNSWDISPETDSGRGPVDFKISRGSDKTVIEIKLTSNKDCVHGIEIQIEEYAKAENTKNKVFVLVDNGVNSERIRTVEQKRAELMKKGKKTAELIIIDAKPKESASKFKK